MSCSMQAVGNCLYVKSQVGLWQSKAKSLCRIHLAAFKGLSEMAAAHHKSLVSSVSVRSLTRIKYRWSAANYSALEISEQAAKKTGKLKK